MRRLALALALAALLSGPPSAAGAQSSDDDHAAALAMMQAGVLAAQDGDWESARVAFSRAYSLVASTRVLMNLAGAQRHTGRLLEARASYEQWLRDATERDAPYRATVEQALLELESETPRVHVRVEGAIPGDTIELDGEAIEPDVDAPANPGPHTVALRRAGETVASERLELAIGETRALALTAPGAAIPDPGPTPPTRSSLFTTRTEGDGSPSPWIWVGVGAGAAVLVGVIIGVAVAASPSGGPPGPDMGTLGPFRL